MKPFKAFAEQVVETDYRKIIKNKKHLFGVAYTYPIGVGGAYYGHGGDNSNAPTSGEGGGEWSQHFLSNIRL